MTLDSDMCPTPDEPRLNRDFRIERWTDQHLHAAAEIISRAYHGRDRRTDSRSLPHHGRSRTVSARADSVPGACFRGPASWIAFEGGAGSPVGFSLAGFVARDVGHIAELCVTPEGSGAGLGQALLARSLHALYKSGANRISLAVSLGNERALRLYRRFGFREKPGFYAYVWERPGERS